MQALSNALIVDFEVKDANHVSYPTINFCDTTSLNTWLEARRLGFKIGERFTRRVHIYTAIWLILSLSFLGFCVLWVGGYLPVEVQKEMTFAHIVSVLVWTFILNIFSLRMLLPVSYLNEQTNDQIK